LMLTVPERPRAYAEDMGQDQCMRRRTFILVKGRAWDFSQM
jgi:hypothetical protein